MLNFVGLYLVCVCFGCGFVLWNFVWVLLGGFFCFLVGWIWWFSGLLIWYFGFRWVVGLRFNLWFGGLWFGFWCFVCVAVVNSSC